MNQKDLSEDVELLMWAKYLSESTNYSLKLLANRLNLWIYDYSKSSDFDEILAADIPQSDWIKAAPLAHCLLQSSNPILEQLAELFFGVLDSITLEMTEIRNNWNPQNTDQPASEVFIDRKDLQDDAPF